MAVAILLCMGASLWNPAPQARRKQGPNALQVVTHHGASGMAACHRLEPGPSERRGIASPGTARRDTRIERIGFEGGRAGALRRLQGGRNQGRRDAAPAMAEA